MSKIKFTLNGLSFTVESQIQINTECPYFTEDNVNYVISEIIRHLKEKHRDIPRDIRIEDDKGCVAYAKDLTEIGNLQIVREPQK